MLARLALPELERLERGTRKGWEVMLPLAEQRAVVAQRKQSRAAESRAHRQNCVQLVRALDVGGAILLIALSQTKLGLGYVLRPGGDDGRLVCSCRGYGWRGDCGHVRAAEQAAERRAA